MPSRPTLDPCQYRPGRAASQCVHTRKNPGATPVSHAIPDDLLQRFDVPGPRYTSYPTADRFVEAFTEADYTQALEQRRAGSLALPLSIYVHIPFCESVCYYCACNKVITKHHGKAAEYLRYLSREMELQVQHLGAGQSVSQLHLGGGTPTFLSDEELSDLMHMIRRHFTLVPGGEYSVEVDPRTVTRERLEVLHRLGFNRLSFGVQDFDPTVQKAVHRVQPAEQVFALVEAARQIGFESVNVDLIYGLPLQTPESFAHTLTQVSLLRPDRIALYAYAHLPSRFKPQRRILSAELPSPGDKLAMLSASLDALGDAGYVYVGMDHFALPGDALAVAKRQGRLHRNFQGYSTRPDCDLIALGVSAIGRIGATYSQNAKTLEEYYDLLDQGRLPIVRGLALNRDDLLRRAVIMSIMCQGELSFESIDLGHLIDSRTYFAREFVALQPLVDAGLVQVNDNGLQVTARGWYLVRAIAMVFDRYLQTDQDRARFSKII
ncbi:oxygen-independent coproporphyrinogen III oxidase [Hydrogenophaga sp. IBVHS2]|nr:oxygen-independent coproporphyrinogen III oxidase [Hydrogenophaga sp. IBVHS2]